MSCLVQGMGSGRTPIGGRPKRRSQGHRCFWKLRDLHTRKTGLFSPLRSAQAELVSTVTGVRKAGNGEE